ncbi:hypothetical protein HDU82_002156, partial [Entophlyctis luteolus]
AGIVVTATTTPSTPTTRIANGTRVSNDAGALVEVQQRLVGVSAQAEEVKSAVLLVEKESHFYFGKLQEVEVLGEGPIESTGTGAALQAPSWRLFHPPEIRATTMKHATLVALLATASASFVSAAKKCAPAAQAAVDAAAVDTAAESDPATTADAPAPAPEAQTAVDAPATTADDIVVVPATSAAQAAAATAFVGDIADPNIPSVIDVGIPSTNGCNAQNLAVCAELALGDYQSADEAAASVGSDFNQACLDLNNHARKFYGNPNPYLTWNEDLANWAVVSAAYALTMNDWEGHSYSGGGYPWGQNLFLGESTCADAYYGWVTSEALSANSNANGHFLNQAGWVSSDGNAYTQVGCGAYGNSIVCNYGLSDVSGALASMPIDYASALALALEGIVD